MKPTYEELEQRLIESERYGRQTYITIENLEQKLAESQREFRAADATIENQQMQLNAEREAKLALAAENAGLKAACERVSMWNDFPQATLRSTGEVVPYVVAYGSNGERDYMRNIAATAVLKYTSETDAFLAEVRAQGVEQLASLAGNECQRYKSVNDRAGARKWKSIVILCTDFAGQLRKGVPS